VLLLSICINTETKSEREPTTKSNLLNNLKSTVSWKRVTKTNGNKSDLSSIKIYFLNYFPNLLQQQRSSTVILTAWKTGVDLSLTIFINLLIITDSNKPYLVRIIKFCQKYLQVLYINF